MPACARQRIQLRDLHSEDGERPGGVSRAGSSIRSNLSKDTTPPPTTMNNNPAPQSTAIPRRHFLGGLAAAGSAFAIPASMVTEATAQNAQPAAPLKGHFHPKGKAPSKFTVEVLKKAKATLPFADKRDFEEQKKGLIAPMKEMKIKADAGHVAWDMERFQFLEKQEDFDSIHPSLLRQSVLNNNYGLYEVIPGIYQVRGFDLSDITFVRGKTGWIVIDPLVSAEPVRAAWKLFQEHVGKGLPVSAVIYSHSHADHWGGVRGIVNEADVRSGKIPVIAPAQLHGAHDCRERLCRQRHEPAAVLPVRPAAARQSARLCRPGPRPGRVGRRGGADCAEPARRKGDRGNRGRWREDDLPEHAEHRSADGDEHLHPRDESAVDGRERHRVAAQHLHAARRSGAQSAELVEVHRPGAPPFRPGGRGHVRLAPLAALGQRADSGSAPRPARPLRPHEQPGAALRQPGRDHQRDSQRL